MTASAKRLRAVFEEAVESLDERSNDYFVQMTSALTRIVRAQDDTATDAARAREVDNVISAVGESIARTGRSDT